MTQRKNVEFQDDKETINLLNRKAKVIYFLVVTYTNLEWLKHGSRSQAHSGAKIENAQNGGAVSNHSQGRLIECQDL